MMKMKMTMEEIEELVRRNNNGESIESLSRELNIPASTLRHRMKKSENYKKLERINYNDDNVIIEINNNLNNQDKTFTQFCRINKYDMARLASRFKELNLSYKSLNNNEKSLDAHSFDVMNEESAYWLGLILADGYISKDGIHLELSLKDKDHIEKFKKFLKSEHKITKRKIKSCNNSVVYRITIGSKYLVSKLEELGIKNNKTEEIINFESIIPKGFERDFIRGFFDGDGGLGTVNTKRNGVKISYIGFTSKFEESLYSLKNVILKFIPDIDINVKTYPNKAPSLRSYKQKDTSEFLDWMYLNSTIYLDRKYNKYKECRLGKKTS